MAAMLFTSCKDDDLEGLRSFNFNASIEQLGNEKGSKVYLVNERWTYWELYDQINIASDVTTSGGTYGYDPEKNYADLVNAGTDDWEDYNGVFISTLPWDSKYFLGLFPRNSGNQIYYESDRNFHVSINLTNTQPLRSDITFARNVFPMVAWYGGHWDENPGSTAFNLDFHSLAGIVRLQFFTTVDKVIDHIEVKSLNNQQLCGQFDVVDYRAFETVKLVPDQNNPEQQKITLTCNGGLPLTTDSLRSFYLVLPATKTMHDSTLHRLEITVVATDGTQCKRTCTTYVRRNGITYMQALGITEWENGGNGTAVAGLVGNGTEARPFKIYNVDDLNVIRNAFAAGGTVKINNVPVTADTRFRIMRSNLTLTTENWTAGIPDFKGHIDYYGANATNPVIINNSNQPLFASISSQGDVRGITMSRNVATQFSIPYDFAFLCNTNNGTITDCKVGGVLRTGTNNNGGLGGICAHNYGTITGCGSTGTLNCEGGFVGGICYTNHTGGIIDGCYASSEMNVTAGQSAAGVCYINQSGATVKNSYFSSRISGSTIAWGGIAYSNAGSLEHCYASSTSFVLTTSSVGGIVNTNATTGTVNYCWSEASVKGTVVGLIAATVNGGTLQNCFGNNFGTTVTTITSASPHHAGGLVGELKGGSLNNSFAYLSSVSSEDASGNVGGLVGTMSGGTIDNCYAYERLPQQRAFYGSKSGGDITNSHLVGGSSATGITGVSLGADNTETNTNLSTMMGALHGIASSIGGYYDWEKPTPSNPATTITVPRLAAYDE